MSPLIFFRSHIFWALQDVTEKKSIQVHLKLTWGRENGAWNWGTTVIMSLINLQTLPRKEDTKIYKHGAYNINNLFHLAEDIFREGNEGACSFCCLACVFFSICETLACSRILFQSPWHFPAWDLFAMEIHATHTHTNQKVLSCWDVFSK